MLAVGSTMASFGLFHSDVRDPSRSTDLEEQSGLRIDPPSVADMKGGQEDKTPSRTPHVGGEQLRLRQQRQWLDFHQPRWQGHRGSGKVERGHDAAPAGVPETHGEQDGESCRGSRVGAISASPICKVLSSAEGQDGGILFAWLRSDPQTAPRRKASSGWQVLRMMAALEQFLIDESWTVASRLTGMEEPPWGH